MRLWERLKDWERDAAIRQAEQHPRAPRPAGQISYVKIFLAVLAAGWVLYALIQASNA